VGCSGVAIVLSVGKVAGAGAVLTGSNSDFNGSTGVGAAMLYIVCYVCLKMAMR
jgi:preprotein translocase subunit SecG